MSPSQTIERLPASEEASNMTSAAAYPGRSAVAEHEGPKPWHVLLATWLGGVFDGMDSSIFAIVLYPSLSELLGTTSHTIVGQHGSYIIALFMVGWAIGAMVFGALADKIGRAKTLTITILLYAIFTGLCALSQNWWQLGLCRFLVGAGIGGEMGVGAVMLSECWPGKSRVHAVSFMATSLGFGYLLTAGLNLWLGHFGWRYLFLAGITPAFLTVYIRAKLKESHHFQEAQVEKQIAESKPEHERNEQDRKVLRSGFREIVRGENLRKTIIVACLTSTAIITWWAVIAWIPAWINQITGSLAVEERSYAMFCKDFGMIASGLLGGVLIKKFGYSRCMAVSCFMAFVCTVGMFMTVKSMGPALYAWVLSVGFFAHVPFVLLWIYIPELYETRIRSTAFGVTYNISRFLAAAAAVGGGELIRLFGGSYAMAASTVASVYLVGVVVSFFMPKTEGKLL
ncbi:MAG: MFS transporter [Candidatus Obscuribacterales bacterium]|nr:MFS transporter [Candidatus Obscuribacterales bacterium]